MSFPALHIQGLAKAFGTTQAVRDFTLTVGSGETVALLGPSGCGKSTVLRCVAGLETPDQGSVSVGGREVTALPPEARYIGLVFQNYALFPHLSVLDNVAFGPRMRGVAKAQAQARARETLDLVGLTTFEKRMPHQLSGGQQQRVALARAIATQAPLLLLDEPLSNLDEQRRSELRAELQTLFDRLGSGVLLVTHDQREALALANQVAIMRNGELVQLGQAQEVFQRPKTAWVAQFLGHRNLLPTPGGVRLVPEAAVILGSGELYPVQARQISDTGLDIQVSLAAGPLWLHLSPREMAFLEEGGVRLRLDETRIQTLPDDRDTA